MVEQLDYDLLFRWFVGLGIDDPVWDRSVFCVNRDSPLSESIARDFFRRVAAIATWQGLVSDEHFSVDGSLIEGQVSQEFCPKGWQRPRQAPGAQSEDGLFGGAMQHATPESTTDPRSGCTRRAKTPKRSHAT